jgi:hypothetical protein
MGIEGLIARACKQTAVYWGDPTPDGYGGRTFGSKYPEEIYCRWEERKELIKDAQGNEVVSHARVFVTEDVDEGGCLFLGTLDDLDSDAEENPMKADGTYEILKFNKIPALGSTLEFTRVAYL